MRPGVGATARRWNVYHFEVRLLFRNNEKNSTREGGDSVVVSKGIMGETDTEYTREGATSSLSKNLETVVG